MLGLLRSLIGYALRNRPYVIFLFIALTFAGVVSYINTPIVAFPDLTSTRIVVITQWPGRSAQEIERFVSIPLETELNSTPKKTSVRSVSLFGLSVVSVLFDDDVEDFEARQYVANRLMNVTLPDNVEAEMLPPQGPIDEIYRYTLHSKQLTIRDLKTLQDWVLDRHLKAVPGVTDVVSFGGEVKTYEVSVDPRLLAKYDITSLDVYDALSRSNINVGGDVIVKSDQAYVVRGIGLLNNVEEIENVIVTNIAGTPLLMKHVGTVRETNAPPLGYVGRDSLQNTVEGIVIMRRGEDPSKVLAALKEKIADLNERVLPADVRIVPFYDRSDLINYTIHTVMHNLIEGVLLVCLVVYLFLADWRTTLICSVVIPFALLFAFFCLRLKGMSANLLSLGAIDFGIIIDGTVVMTEGLFIVLEHKAQEMGMERFNRTSKLGLINKAARELARSVFFAALIIITALLPIFSFQRVEGKMFSPLAYTLGFALLGSLIASLTFVPVMVSFMLNKNVVERHTFMTRGLQSSFAVTLAWCAKHRKVLYVVAFGVWSLAIGSAFTLGTEFLPHLNEGAIYIRASLPYSTSLQQSIEVTEKIRGIIRTYPEVKRVLSQTGRPNDGTDATGFFNIEFHTELKPKDEWTTGRTKDELIETMKTRLAQFQGINFNFSQPIMDNVEEAVSGVKGSLSVKIYGYDPYVLEAKAKEVYGILKKVRGVEDLGIIGLVGQPELRIELNQAKMAAYGVATRDAQAVIEMAIGGKAATQMYEGERRFDIRVRYATEFRQSEDAIGNLLVPTINGTKVPLKLISEIKNETGMAFLYREDNARFIAVKFSVRGRDMGSTVNEARQIVAKQVTLDKGMKIAWKGEFENQERAVARLKIVIPISLAIIFVLLYTAFNNLRDAALIFLNIPFGLMGGIMALHFTGIHFSISAGIGFICLFGVSTQAGIILISIFRQNLAKGMSLREAVYMGTLRRVRPVFMTGLMAVIGLMPAALSTGIGSETQKPLAVVVIGGLITDMLLALHVFPLIVEWVYARLGVVKEAPAKEEE
jgi:cobalt-zinc-cadmium resistance protein CzcA